MVGGNPGLWRLMVLATAAAAWVMVWLVIVGAVRL